MVKSLPIVFIIISGIMAIGVPIVCFIYIYQKYRISWKPIVTGVLIFIIFSQVFEQLLHTYILKINLQIQEWMENPYLYSLYGGLAAGVFEEVGRFIGYQYLLEKYREWKDGIAYGIGHGGIESILIACMLVVPMVINVLFIHTGGMEPIVQNGNISSVYGFLLLGFERVFAFAIQLALSLVLLYGIGKKKNYYLLYVILIHSAIDFVVVLFQTFHFSMLLIDGFVCVMALFSFKFVIKSKELFKNRC